MTSPWHATAARRPRESTCRSTRASSSLCRCAASGQPPRGERRRRGETERSQCEHARTRTRRQTAGVQGRCAAGASSLHWYTGRPHPIVARAAALALVLALTLARCPRRGCRGSDRARGAGPAAAEGRRPRHFPRHTPHGHTYGPAGARREGGQLGGGLTNVSTVLIPNFWASHCLARVRKVGARCRPPARPETRPLCGERISCSTSAGALALSSRFRSRHLN